MHGAAFDAGNELRSNPAIYRPFCFFFFPCFFFGPLAAAFSYLGVRLVLFRSLGALYDHIELVPRLVETHGAGSMPPTNWQGLADLPSLTPIPRDRFEGTGFFLSSCDAGPGGGLSPSLSAAGLRSAAVVCGETSWSAVKHSQKKNQMKKPGSFHRALTEMFFFSNFFGRRRKNNHARLNRRRTDPLSRTAISGKPIPSLLRPLPQASLLDGHARRTVTPRHRAPPGAPAFHPPPHEACLPPPPNSTSVTICIRSVAADGGNCR